MWATYLILKILIATSKVKRNTAILIMLLNQYIQNVTILTYYQIIFRINNEILTVFLALSLQNLVLIPHSITQCGLATCQVLSRHTWLTAGHYIAQHRVLPAQQSQFIQGRKTTTWTVFWNKEFTVGIRHYQIVGTVGDVKV